MYWHHHGRCGSKAQAAAATKTYGAYRRPKFNIPANIAEHETGYEIYLYALGYDKANIQVTVTDKVLYVTGTREPGENFKPNFIRQEFPIKSFEKVFHLNDGIATDQISARQEDGVLIISLPKKAEAQWREQQIEIE